MLTCWKIQLCTVNKSWEMDILKFNKYCILCSIALIHVKIEIWKTTLKLLYMIDYLLFNHIKRDVNLCQNSIMYSKLKKWDMDILKCNKYCILCYIALIHVKIEIWKTTLKIM